MASIIRFKTYRIAGMRTISVFLLGNCVFKASVRVVALKRKPVVAELPPYVIQMREDTREFIRRIQEVKERDARVFAVRERLQDAFQMDTEGGR